MVLYRYHFIIFNDRGAFFNSSVTEGRRRPLVPDGKGEIAEGTQGPFPAVSGCMVKSHASVTAFAVERYLQYVGIVYVLDVAAALCAGAFFMRGCKF